MSAVTPEFSAGYEAFEQGKMYDPHWPSDKKDGFVVRMRLAERLSPVTHHDHTNIVNQVQAIIDAAKR